MTPSIFATKWLAKFQEFIVHKYNNPAYKSHEPFLCDISEEGFDLLLNFHIQAGELNLTQDDFPNEAMHTPASPGVDTLNPFIARATVLLTVDDFVRTIERMKTKGEIRLGQRWQELPLAWRQRMNDLFPRIEEARKEGWWATPEVEKVEEIFRKTMSFGKGSEVGFKITGTM